jgi:asparagine synthase (glutamine-hydrolysing)
LCGIAGAINLSQPQGMPPEALRAMARSLVHRGPDEDGFFERGGVSLASRRLSIVGVADGRQPIANADSSVFVVFNGALFDYPELKADLESRGHRFRTHCDTEIVPHAWDEYREDMWPHLRGQFAFALWDQPRQTLILGRDRFGICPLYWTRVKNDSGDWLLFASEIKALLASGFVRARADPRGIDNAFTFFGIPGPVTCFAGVRLLIPGHYLAVRPAWGNGTAQVAERAYWKLEFPDRGDEINGDSKKLVDEFEEVLTGAVARRLRADVPVVSYLSGGVDSSVVVALASRVLGRPIPTFTVQVLDRQLDEKDNADLVANYIGCPQTVVPYGAAQVLNIYPRLVAAAESPVIDTSSGALLMLSAAVHSKGYKVALTGEGADEWLAGYPWYKMHRILQIGDSIPGIKISNLFRSLYVRFNNIPGVDANWVGHAERLVGGSNAWLDVYGIMNVARVRLFSRELAEAVSGRHPYEDLELEPERIARWHPLNRSLYLGARIHLPGLLLNHKGDRVAMHNSVETRYPFLDERVFEFLAKIHPRWKLRGLGDKHILRRLAERHLPSSVAWRRKGMFLAPADSFHEDRLPPFVDQLLSNEALEKTGYFDPAAVATWRQRFRSMRASYNRLAVEWGLVGVISTQLWHHIYIDSSLADLPASDWQ